MTTFRNLKKLMDLKATPEPGEGFWDTYLPRLREKMQLEPAPLYLRLRPIPLISSVCITLVALTVLTTINLYKPPVLNLESLPRKSVVENLEELEYFISENFDSENVVKGFFPEEIISPIIGGGHYEGI